MDKKEGREGEKKKTKEERMGKREKTNRQETRKKKRKHAEARQSAMKKRSLQAPSHRSSSALCPNQADRAQSAQGAKRRRAVRAQRKRKGKSRPVPNPDASRRRQSGASRPVGDEPGRGPAKSRAKRPTRRIGLKNGRWPTSSCRNRNFCRTRSTPTVFPCAAGRHSPASSLGWSIDRRRGRRCRWRASLWRSGTQPGCRPNPSGGRRFAARPKLRALHGRGRPRRRGRPGQSAGRRAVSGSRAP